MDLATCGLNTMSFGHSKFLNKIHRQRKMIEAGYTPQSDKWEFDVKELRRLKADLICKIAKEGPSGGILSRKNKKG